MSRSSRGRLTQGDTMLDSTTTPRSISIPSPSPRPNPHRLRSRTSSILYPTPMPPVMSRENSSEDLHQVYEEGEDVRSHNEIVDQEILSEGRNMSHSLEERNLSGPSRYMVPPTGRRASKSVSSQKRPPIVSSPRTVSYTNALLSPTDPVQSLAPFSPVQEKRMGLKRRISTPNMLPEQMDVGSSSTKGKERAVETRARATSTSIALPEALAAELAQTYAIQPVSASAPTERQKSSARLNVPHLDLGPTTFIPSDLTPPPQQSTSFLTNVYNATESTISSIVSFARARTIDHQSRTSTDSERLSSEDELESGESSGARNSFESGSIPFTEPRQERVGRFWGLEEKEDYFSRPPSPEAENGPNDTFINIPGYQTSLPTPALSAHSLSHGANNNRHGFRTIFGQGRSSSTSRARENGGEGWLASLAGVLGGRGTSKTAEVLREMGWTVAALVAMFIISLGVVVLSIGSMPITTLKHLPTSTTDLQLLSAEIRSYMATSISGWWHTVFVVTYVGCWKHAWSVPGAVVLNILVGSILEPIPAVSLLTFITATGSLGAYLLSRPLAPLIGVIFPKPLSLVRAALAPESAPPTSSSNDIELVTPIVVVPGQQPVGGEEAKPQVWRRLLIMRAGGFVPWSGMNVACGVVGVDWRVFWLTTAAGSASWSYVTASVGNILSRLAVPSTTSNMVEEGESLTSLLRDPSLIFKLVILSLLTLLPVLMKRKANSPAPSSTTLVTPDRSLNPIITNLKVTDILMSPASPMSPISSSLTKFTPTPAAFDLLSFARTGVRQGGRFVVGGIRGAAGGVGRVVSSFSR